MMIRKRVPAFTIMEVTISMLIAAIVIGITYSAYHIVSVTYSAYTKKQNRVAELMVADKLLKRDFLIADLIIRSSDGLELESGKSVVKYQFMEESILRTQSALQTDTFKIPVKSCSFSFENQHSEDGTTVDQLTFETRLEGENIPLVYHKVYSAQNLLR